MFGLGILPGLHALNLDPKVAAGPVTPFRGRHRKTACLLDAIGNIGLVMNAIETTGVVDAQHQLRLDKPLPIAGQSRVRVIVLVPEEADLSETAWTKTAATSPAFDFLKDKAEDIYTAADGKPFHDQG
jgi:hypothetical protein